MPPPSFVRLAMIRIMLGGLPQATRHKSKLLGSALSPWSRPAAVALFLPLPMGLCPCPPAPRRAGAAAPCRQRGLVPSCNRRIPDGVVTTRLVSITIRAKTVRQLTATICFVKSPHRSIMFTTVFDRQAHAKKSQSTASCRNQTRKFVPLFAMSRAVASYFNPMALQVLGMTQRFGKVDAR